MKGKLNFIIDALMFLLMAAIAGLGFLMKYVLVPGKDRVARFGRQVDLYFRGWDRHEWGTVHLVLGYALLVFPFIAPIEVEETKPGQGHHATIRPVPPDSTGKRSEKESIASYTTPERRGKKRYLFQMSDVETLIRRYHRESSAQSG